MWILGRLHFIGNKVSVSHGNDLGIGLYAAYAIGNEFIRDLDTNPPTYVNSNYNLVIFYAPQQTGLTGKWPLIANNVFRVIGGPGSAPGTPVKDMVSVNLSANSQLHNNIIDYSALHLSIYLLCAAWQINVCWTMPPRRLAPSI